MSLANIPSLSQLRDCFNYEVETGALTWKKSNRGLAGCPAGFSPREGDWAVKVNGKKYDAVKVAWYLATGSWPARRMLFLNGRRDDRRLVNLAVDTPAPMLTAARARALFDYDPETGVFQNKTGRGGITVGAVAGFLGFDEYWRLQADGRTYAASRVAWLYVHGEWPPGELDHKNGQRLDNRIENLRPATRVQNIVNRKVSVTNKLGINLTLSHYIT